MSFKSKGCDLWHKRTSQITSTPTLPSSNQLGLLTLLVVRGPLFWGLLNAGRLECFTEGYFGGIEVFVFNFACDLKYEKPQIEC